MKFELIFNDALEYTRETFIGHWGRWLIFIILGLPFSLIRFVVDPGKIITGATIHWDLIPWGSIAILVVVGIFASFFISGYMVRIYRGVKPAPDFANWASLFIDGLKLDIVMFVWFLPAILLMLLLMALGLGGILLPGILGGIGNTLAFILAVIILVIAALVLLIIAALYVTMGAVRFARTGSMVEGLRYSALSEIIRRMGWGNYILALIFMAVVSFFFSLIVSIPAVIPYFGWIIPVCLSPLLTVFTARYFMQVYEAGEAPPPATPAP
ncbi:MAG: DUF4013 domain-containing protein [Methanomicrobiales archaeon]|nr:DUF4013 domain-containing protein [Methanomicrobiales archaeon]